MLKNIVVGVDSSEPSKSAAAKAAHLAQALGAELHVVSAYGRFEAERIQVGGDSYLITNHDDALGVAQQTIAGLRSTHPDLKVHAVAADGKPADALVRIAVALDADLIVVGNKRVQGLARVLGSIARDVAKAAHCDVYVAHTTG